jgi:methyl-accepting chemotaxis protein
MKLAKDSLLQPSKIGIKARLLSAVVLTITTTAAIVYFPWSWTSKRNVDSVVAQITEGIAQDTAKEVGHIFDNVESTYTVIQQMFSGLVDVNSQTQRESFYLKLLIGNQNFSWLELGFPDGDLVGANRDSQGRLSIVRRDWDPAKKSTTKITNYYEIRADGNRITETKTLQENYYAPQRPWYQAALKTPGQLAWSDVYVFRTSKTPGISATHTLQQGETLLGVVSISFELKSISTYLRSLQKDQPGAIFIVNSKGDLVAFTNPNESAYTLVEQDQARLKTLSEAQDPYLQLVNQAIQDRGMQLDSITKRLDFSVKDKLTREAAYISLSPLGYLDWVVGTVIPESNYLGEINRNKQILVIVICGFVIIAAVGAVIFTDRTIAEPILSITNAASAIETEKFDEINLQKVSKRTDELGQLARVFQRMAQEVYAREQQLKQQLQDLKIEIDESKRKKQVSEIVETDFFKDLQAKARKMRSSSRSKPGESTPPAAP